MKEIEFTAEGAPDVEALKRQLFGESDDPRSIDYVRKLIRPKINWFLIILNVLMPLLIDAALIFVAVKYLGLSAWVAVLGAAVLSVVYMLIRVKSILICIVQIYQRYAPSSVRNKCRFEPSCSQYMIMSLQKHGAFKGLKKGIGRIRRCNVNDGGYDYP